MAGYGTQGAARSGGSKVPLALAVVVGLVLVLVVRSQLAGGGSSGGTDPAARGPVRDRLHPAWA